MKKSVLFTIIVVSHIFFVGPFAFGFHGDLDTTLDGDGILVSDVGKGGDDEIRALAIQGESYILAAGSANGEFPIRATLPVIIWNGVKKVLAKILPGPGEAMADAADGPPMPMSGLKDDSDQWV